jgi:hypothetical protein
MSGSLFTVSGVNNLCDGKIKNQSQKADIEDKGKPKCSRTVGAGNLMPRYTSGQLEINLTVDESIHDEVKQQAAQSNPERTNPVTRNWAALFGQP